METVKVKELFTNKTEWLVPALTLRLLGSCKQSSKDKKDHLEGDFAQKREVFTYLKDLDRGLIDGDRRPSSSMRLGLESLDEKWR